MWPAARIALVAQLTLLVACGPTAPRSLLPATHADAATTMRDGQRPPLTVIRRQGNPEPALAVAVAHDAGPNFNRGLARALVAELSRVGLQPRVSLFTRGLVVSMRVGSAKASLASDVRKAVLGAADTAKPEPSSAALDPCDPLPTFSLERAELGRQNVALALVGDPERVDALADSFGDTDEWPSGDVPEASLPGNDLYVVSKSQKDAISVALVTPSAGRLAAARRALLQNELLGYVAREYPPGFTLDGVGASQLPAGGCLSLTFGATGPVREQDAARLLLSVSALAQTELRAAAEADSLVPALLAGDSTNAAELAAWQGLAAPAGEGDPRTVVVRHSPAAIRCRHWSTASWKRPWTKRARARQSRRRRDSSTGKVACGPRCRVGARSPTRPARTRATALSRWSTRPWTARPARSMLTSVSVVPRWWPTSRYLGGRAPMPWPMPSRSGCSDRWAANPN